MSGGWLFGYIDALAALGVGAVLVCVTGRVDEPVRRTHRPSGAPMWLLPATGLYRLARRALPTPYAWDRASATNGLRGIRAGLAAVLRPVAPYLSTPPWALATVLRRERCFALLCQEYEEPRFDVCIAVGSILRLPVFATFQGGDRQRSGLERIVRRRALHAAAGLIVASSVEKERLRRRYQVPTGRIAQIFNPLDIDRWPLGDRAAARAQLGVSDSAKVVVWHGRVELYRKGLDVLVEAWELLGTAHPDDDLQLLLVGNGADAPKLRALLADRRLRGVRWVDSYLTDRSRIRPYLDAADVYAFPSRLEGFPVAPVEAMACGLPLVAADAAGVNDILALGEEHGGIVVRRGDAVTFAAALARLLQDQSLCRQLGVRARARAESAFSLSTVGSQLQGFLADGAVNKKCRTI
ncbi:MAG: glycosyltransferase family 4 protein [Geodermatophilaceae bacterium]|nr:glycosyltransferase family 4 protein [Geodermatophilaceae bacterium]